MPEIKDVRSYWEENPLFSFELEKPGTPHFFDKFDDIKRNDVERFAMDFWEFNAYRNKSILDIGCGPGWLTVQYSKAGSNVSSVDLTDAAVGLTRQHLQHYGLHAEVQQGNAEDLPFEDGHFDMVFSSGVLHHTPNTQKAFEESHRVLRPGGIAKITLYRLGILHAPIVFPMTKYVMRAFAVKHAGADMAREAQSVGEFVRQYDGKENPVGIAKSDRDWAKDLELAGYSVLNREVHFFPRRFVPIAHMIPESMHKILDNRFGTMVYFNLQKN